MRHYVWMLAALSFAAGCALPGPKASQTVSRPQLRRDALACLRAAIGYQANPVVRVEAVEALASSGLSEGQPWIRTALVDEHPAVRFAACVAAGMSADPLARSALRHCLTDDDASVRVAALFAVHRLGFPAQTGRMVAYLLGNEDPSVRRNAALVLGLLGEQGAIKILSRAMRDEDEGVRQHALEAMARLGNREAGQELSFMTNSGVGSEEVFAIVALAQTDQPKYLDMLRYKLSTAVHLETGLAAARGLGLLGSDDGFEIALGGLTDVLRARKDPNDSPAQQFLRIRQMAAAALGAIGRVDALGALSADLHDPSDPRIQVSAARAILEILEANRTEDLPFGPVDKRNRRR